MKKLTLSATDARNEFFRLINAVYYGGQVTIIEKNGEEVAKIVPTEKKKSANLFVPTVVIVEFWAGSEMEKKKNRETSSALFRAFEEIPLDGNIAKKSGELLRKKLCMDPIDAIIAATALKFNAMVATRNKKHFQKIPGLKLF